MNKRIDPQAAFEAVLDRVKQASIQLAAAGTDADRARWQAELHQAIVAFEGIRVMPVKLTYSVEEAAELLGVSRAFAYECIARGLIPHMRVGTIEESGQARLRGRIRVPHSALMRFIEASTVEAPR